MFVRIHSLLIYVRIHSPYVTYIIIQKYNFIDVAGHPNQRSHRLLRYLHLYSGCIYDGLLLHPDNEHIVYPLGSTVVVRHILSRTQSFLRGHQHRISCSPFIIQLSKYPKMVDI